MRKRKHATVRSRRTNPYRRDRKSNRKKTFTYFGLGLIALVALSVAM